MYRSSKAPLEEHSRVTINAWPVPPPPPRCLEKRPVVLPPLATSGHIGAHITPCRTTRPLRQQCQRGSPLIEMPQQLDLASGYQRGLCPAGDQTLFLCADHFLRCSSIVDTVLQHTFPIITSGGTVAYCGGGRPPNCGANKQPKSVRPQTFPDWRRPHVSALLLLSAVGCPDWRK